MLLLNPLLINPLLLNPNKLKMSTENTRALTSFKNFQTIYSYEVLNFFEYII